MTMTRRRLLSLLAGLPLVGRFVPQAESAPVMQHVLKPCGYHVYAFLVDRDGNRHCAGYQRVEYMTREQLEKEYPS
jgi:hypothetical protein